MTAMFPGSGVPAADARNSIPSPDVNANCDPLWYSTSRCLPRFDPAAANAVLAELVNLINKGEVEYDCDFLNNVETAVRYLIQRGIPRGGDMTGGPLDYIVTLDPPATRYNDYMTLSLVPKTDNTGNTRVNINGLGLATVLRNDGQQLKALDLRIDRPVTLMYYGGTFYVVGFVASQLPAVLGPNMVLYVNASTGNDSVYDGSQATVSGGKGPFKTISRAMLETFKYGPSLYTMDIEVAAGTYTEAVETPNITGPGILINGAGKQQTFVTGANNKHTFNITAGNHVTIQNLHVATGTGTGPPCCFMSQSGASVFTNNTASSFCQYAIWEAYTGYIFPGTHDFDAGSTCAYIFGSFFNSFLGLLQNSVFTFLGTITVSGAVASATSGGTMSVPVPVGTPTFVNPGSVIGTKYDASVNGVINVGGLGVNYFPGTVAGGTSLGGQYV